MRLQTRGPRTAQAIAACEPFTTSGALYAEPGHVYTFPGHLPASIANDERDSLAAADYVVYSYATPIAWHVPGKGWTIPSVKYSVTTTKHQGNLYMIPSADVVSRPTGGYWQTRDGLRVDASTGGGWGG